MLIKQKDRPLPWSVASYCMKIAIAFVVVELILMLSIIGIESYERVTVFDDGCGCVLLRYDTVYKDEILTGWEDEKSTFFPRQEAR